MSAEPTGPDELRKSDTVGFAHASERQFAQLLDFYGIEWEYEPTSFDIEWDSDGNVLQRFTPDFYLPAYDLYIEITTLNQKLVTKKNRKVRRLRERYPGDPVQDLLPARLPFAGDEVRPRRCVRLIAGARRRRTYTLCS